MLSSLAWRTTRMALSACEPPWVSWRPRGVDLLPLEPPTSPWRAATVVLPIALIRASSSVQRDVVRSEVTGFLIAFQTRQEVTSAPELGPCARRLVFPCGSPASWDARRKWASCAVCWRIPAF